ncbi:MAG: TIM barrel protein [Anaerolineae bacterium]|nr:TIM barrel protein [Anaerolineae bacterium]
MLKIANAPCSWGIIENVAGGRSGYAAMLDEMQETGYVGTELGDWGFMPTDPTALAQELQARHLALLGSWVSVYLHDPDRLADSEAAAVRTARLLAEVGGPDALIVLGNDPYGNPMRTKNAGRIKPEHAMSDDQWQTFAAGANHIAQAVKRETGLRTVFHHHIGTWVETPAETARFLSLTDPDVVGLCFDTGHYRFGGGDPVAGLRRHADRVWHVHFKDHDPRVAAQSRQNEWDGVESVGHGVFCELGRGDVDFPAVTRTLNEIGYRGWIVVEQDVLPGMGTPKDSAQRNRDYLRSIGL